MGARFYLKSFRLIKESPPARHSSIYEKQNPLGNSRHRDTRPSPRVSVQEERSEMNVVQFACQKGCKTTYQMFWLAYSILYGNEDEEYVNFRHDAYVRDGTIPFAVETFCDEVMRGEREV